MVVRTLAFLVLRRILGAVDGSPAPGSPRSTRHGATAVDLPTPDHAPRTLTPRTKISKIDKVQRIRKRVLLA